MQNVVEETSKIDIDKDREQLIDRLMIDTSDRPRVPLIENWYQRNIGRIERICKIVNIPKKVLYHLLLKRLGEKYDLDAAKGIYTETVGVEPQDKYTIGYSSFKLDHVVKWLNDYFEFYGEAKVSCDNDGWIPVQGRLPEDNHKGIYDMQLVTLEDGEVCMGVYNNREKEWWTRKQEGERWYTNKHNVIAWQPLPEPYKEEKKC